MIHIKEVELSFAIVQVICFTLDIYSGCLNYFIHSRVTEPTVTKSSVVKRNFSINSQSIKMYLLLFLTNLFISVIWFQKCTLGKNNKNWFQTVFNLNR